MLLLRATVVIVIDAISRFHCIFLLNYSLIMPLEKTEKLVRLCNAQGKRISGALQVVREHYLREDVPCFSALCLAGCQNIQG